MKKQQSDFEIYCYETDKGEICLEFGEAAINFTKKRFIEFADKLNEIRENVMLEYLQNRGKNSAAFNNRYRI